MLVTIISIVVALSLLTPVISLLVLPRWFRRRYTNNPDKCYVKVLYGESYRTYKGKFSKTIDPKGKRYDYRVGFHKRQVYINENYPYTYENGRLLIFIRNGNISTPLTDNQIIMSPDELWLLIKSDCIGQGVNTIVGSGFNMKILWIIGGIAVVGIAGYFIYTQFIAPKPPEVVPPVTEPTESTLLLEQVSSDVFGGIYA